MYYLAVDGGGTKTDYAIIDGSGRIVDQYEGEGTNHETFPDSYEGMYFVLYEAIHAMLLKNNISVDRIKDAVLGLAGADHEYQKQEIGLRLERIGLKRYFICNDGFLPVKSETEHGVGIAYNCGTGVCCDAINSEGQMLQLGGLGWHSGDLCGGNVIVEKSFAAMYGELFLNEPKTLISDLYCEEFRLNSKSEIYDSIRLLGEDPSYRKRTISVFFKALDLGDSVAEKIARDMMHRGVQYVSSAYRILKFDGRTEIILTGGIHTKANSKRYVAMFCEELERVLSGMAEFKIAQSKPVWGAIKWVAERNGIKINR